VVACLGPAGSPPSVARRSQPSSAAAMWTATVPATTTPRGAQTAIARPRADPGRHTGLARTVPVGEPSLACILPPTRPAYLGYEPRSVFAALCGKQLGTSATVARRRPAQPTAVVYWVALARQARRRARAFFQRQRFGHLRGAEHHQGVKPPFRDRGCTAAARPCGSAGPSHSCARQRRPPAPAHRRRPDSAAVPPRPGRPRPAPPRSRPARLAVTVSQRVVPSSSLAASLRGLAGVVSFGGHGKVPVDDLVLLDGGWIAFRL
jgi:hypothetical protein